MDKELYSTSVFHDCILVYGILSMEDTIDLMCQYKKLGFNEIRIGHENSTLAFYKGDHEGKIKSKEECKDHMEEKTFDPMFWKELFLISIEQNKDLIKKLREFVGHEN